MQKILYSFWLFIVLFIPFAAHSAPYSTSLQFLDKQGGGYVDAPGIASDIRTDINDTMAKTHVVQYFYNNTDEWQEGRYTYPLPENAAVDKLVMVVGERRILGFVAEKEEARRIYEKAKAEGKATSLVEQHRPNIFKTAVANIPPRSLIAIEIAYQHEIQIEKNQFSMRLPLAITPRYDHFNFSDFLTLASENGEQNKTYDIVQRLQLFDFESGENPSHIEVNANFSFDVTPLQSESHEITKSKIAKNGYFIKVDQKNMVSDRDFIVTWNRKYPEKIIVSTQFERIDEDVFTHVLLLPPENISSDNGVRFFAKSDKEAQDRQVILVIDTSGSMSGPSIRQAKSALREAIYDLRPSDKFNLIRFSSDTSALFEVSVFADENNVKEALRWVDQLQADGGTEMLPAIQRALSEQIEKNFLSQVVFITDGAIGFESQIAQSLKDRIGNRRFFAVGIGAAPNTHLMDLFARIGRGSATYIHDISQTQERMTKLFEQMKAPVVTDLALKFTGMEGSEVIPAKLPDLLAGQPLSVVVRSSEPLKDLSVTGNKSGQGWEQPISMQPKPFEGTGKLYARKKISDLNANHPYGEDAKIKPDITDLGISHQILTKYTSFVAVDEEILRPKNATLVTHIHNPNLPKGWQLADYNAREAAEAYKKAMSDKAGGEDTHAQDLHLPQTADGYMLRLVLGLVLFSLGYLGLLGLKGRENEVV